MDTRSTRRSVLSSAAVFVSSVAGCLSSNRSPDSTAEADSSPPTREVCYPRVNDAGELWTERLTSGAGYDGIPAIDDPQFDNVASANERLDPGSPVFGIDYNNEQRAYPQHILVHHEVVNDTIGDDPVVVTYCPLTGTVLAFKRGTTTFGVAGTLLNSNLILFDRGTNTRWSQMLGVGIRGQHVGDSLIELPITWTTWQNWRETYPDTEVLTSETGHLRRYNNDPRSSVGDC